MEALLIERSLVPTDPGEAQRRSNLAGTLNELGNLQASQNDLAAARASFQESLALERGIAAADADDIRAAHEQAASLRKLGNVLRLQGDNQGARKLFEEGVSIRRRLTATHPGDPDYESDVWFSLYGLARVPGSGVAWRDVIARD